MGRCGRGLKRSGVELDLEIWVGAAACEGMVEGGAAATWCFSRFFLSLAVIR